jgi:hypothetical protein
MSINFLLQSLRIIHIGNYDDTEIRMIYDYLRNLDNVILNDYFNSHQVLQYENDLDFCVEIINKMIIIFEAKEEYEKCQVLLNKKEEALNIININVEKYERI